MEKDQLARVFRDDIHDMEDQELLAAILELRCCGRILAETLNKFLPESASKADVLSRLFRIGVDAELAIRMDGISRVQSPIVMTRQ